MSYAVMPYALTLQDVHQLIGCGDEREFERAAARLARQLASLDELIADNGHADVVSARDALRDLIVGGDYQGSYEVGFVYGYLFQALCTSVGQPLANESWSGMRYAWFEWVSKELRAAGAEFDATDLISRGAGVPLPSTDFPGIGHYTAAQIPAVLATLSAVRDEDIADEDVLRAVREVRGWFQYCADRALDLVCFYH